MNISNLPEISDSFPNPLTKTVFLFIIAVVVYSNVSVNLSFNLIIPLNLFPFGFDRWHSSVVKNKILLRFSSQWFCREKCFANFLFWKHANEFIFMLKRIKLRFARLPNCKCFPLFSFLFSLFILRLFLYKNEF